MNDILDFMLKRYNCQNQADYENALKEIIQEISLLGLWRTKFFEKAAFYGGTALRILYGLDRFSEDLDFSLLKPQEDFQLDEYLKGIDIELQGFGFAATLEEKIKTSDSTIQSAFIKANTKEHLLKIKAPAGMYQRIHKQETLKIKIEIDTDPPGHFNTESKLLLLPIPFSVNTYQLPDLFAGKMHALLCRPWKTRIKGRDWYDLVWYTSRNIPINLQHLQSRLVQSGHWEKSKKIARDDLICLLKDKISMIDFQQAKRDVFPFLKNESSIALWSNDFFNEIADRIKVC